MTDKSKTPAAMVLVDRELLERVAAEANHMLGFTYASNYDECRSSVDELRALLDSPAEQTPAVCGDLGTVAWMYILTSGKNALFSTNELEKRGGIALCRAADVATLQAEVERLKTVTNFEEAVACVFDYLKISACNTSSREWDETLEELAEDVIEYAPRYKRQWKDICTLQARIAELEAQLANKNN